MRPAKRLGRFLWKGGDGALIDGFGPDGVSARVLDVTRNVVRLQTGYLYHYAFAMLIGVAAFVTWFMFGGGCTHGELADPLRRHLPAAARRRASSCCVRGDDDARARHRALDRAVDDARHLRHLADVGRPFRSVVAGFQFVEKHDVAAAIASYHMGVDGISLLFVILTTALMPFCIIASWTAIQTRVQEYMIAFLVLETLMIGIFSALDLVLFYLFFEGGLIPMFLIIGVWGGPRRVYASFKFFLYTLLGSVLMLLAIMAMYWDAGTTDIPALMHHGFPLRHADLAVARLLRLLRGQDADVAGPHLAARRARRGADRGLGDPGRHPAEDGRLRLPALLAADVSLAPATISRRLVFTLSVVAIIYTSLVALVQEDMKKLIAYSSVAHMGFVTMGIFAATTQGVEGGIFQMLTHGIVSGALFLCVGVVYDRMHTREIAAYGGLVNRMPLYAACSWCSRWPMSACRARPASSASSCR